MFLLGQDTFLSKDFKQTDGRTDKGHFLRGPAWAPSLPRLVALGLQRSIVTMKQATFFSGPRGPTLTRGQNLDPRSSPDPPPLPPKPPPRGQLVLWAGGRARTSPSLLPRSLSGMGMKISPVGERKMGQRFLGCAQVRVLFYFMMRNSCVPKRRCRASSKACLLRVLIRAPGAGERARS